MYNSTADVQFEWVMVAHAYFMVMVAHAWGFQLHYSSYLDCCEGMASRSGTVYSSNLQSSVHCRFGGTSFERHRMYSNSIEEQ